jgi:CRP-like cAMP-binding protein
LTLPPSKFTQAIAATGETEINEIAAKYGVLRALPSTLLQQCNLLEATSGEILARLGSVPKWVMFVVSGEVRLLRYLPNGSEAVLQRAHHGLIAEASIESARYHCHVVAARASRLLRIPLQPFRDELRNNEVLRREWIERLTREVMRLRAQSERLNLNSAADRIVHYIEIEGSHQKITLYGTKKMWAAELGLSHEALYRTLRHMIDTGVLIQVDAATFFLADSARL